MSCARRYGLPHVVGEMAQVKLLAESASVRLQTASGSRPMDGQSRAGIGEGQVRPLNRAFSPQTPLRGHIFHVKYYILRSICSSRSRRSSVTCSSRSRKTQAFLSSRER